MTRGKIVSILASFAFCAFSAHAVDWTQYGGKTYNVPADTTNEVTEADFDAFNAISTVVFENENSAILITTSNFPNRVFYQGPGSVIMQEKAIFQGGGYDTIIRRKIGTGNENDFVKFVFKEGMNSTGGTADLYYFYDGSKHSVSNATLYLDGTITNVSFYGADAGSINGRIDLGENINMVSGLSIAGNNDNTKNYWAVIRQRGGQVWSTGYYLGFKGSATAAYFLENGSLTAGRNSDSRWYVFSRYLHFRQTGGTFVNTCWHRDLNQNDEFTLPADFIYGGSAIASAWLENSTPKFLGPMNLTVMGNAQVDAGYLQSYVSAGGLHKHIISVNGGKLTMNTRNSSVNVYYAFNGGTLMETAEGSNMFGNNIETNNPVWVRIYEKGGCIYNNNGTTSNNQYLNLPNIMEPVGNVVLSVEMSDELRNKVWQTPPSVEITDSTGAGSNAVAIVDYDFDSGKVTNITVACRGENYSGESGVVTANLRNKAGEALLSTPLVCTVGFCQGGDVTFAGGKTIYARGCTNTYHGATIIDMDRDGVYDHPVEGSNLEPVYHSLYLKSSSDPRPRFLNSTSVVVRSGCLWHNYDGDSFSKSFPACQRLGFYGGHFSYWSVSMKDVVVGGETWLNNHKFERPSSVTIPADGTLTVDYGAVVTNGVIVTPTLKYGTFKFTSGAKIAVKNLDLLSNDGAQVLLDLSGVTTLNGTPQVVPVAGYSIRWDATAKKLMGLRRKGFSVSFR